MRFPTRFHATGRSGRLQGPRRHVIAAVAAALAAACAPEAGPVTIAVLALDPDTSLYVLAPVEVTTLTDVPSLTGDAATPVGSAKIVVDVGEFTSEPTEQQFRDTVIKEAGAPVEAQFLEQDGVLWPLDFHSLNLATSYYNFERSRLYALDRGLSADGPMKGVTFFYFPEFQLLAPGLPEEPLADNAAFYPLLHSFFLLPFDQLQYVPLPMNIGVIAHEYAHGIFNAEVHEGAWIPDHAQRWDPAASGTVLLGVLEEGLADAWGVGVSGDPRFATHSLREYVGDVRDVDLFDAGRHCYSQAAFDGELAAYRGDDEYWLGRQYELGSAFSQALWEAGKLPGVGYERVMDSVLRSYRASGETSLHDQIRADPDGRRFGRLVVPVRALAAGAVDEQTRGAICALLPNRLGVSPAELGGACDGAPSVSVPPELLCP